MNKFVDAAILAFTIVILVLFFGRLSSAALSGGPAPAPSGSRHAGQSAPEHPDRDIARVVTILESRIGDAGLPGEAKTKLASMGDEDYRLVSSLCDRIAGAGNRAGADVALVLVTALIVMT